MKITIDIDDEEIRKAVVDLVIDRVAETVEHEIFTDGHYSVMRRLYREGVQDQTRQLIKQNLDDIVNRAVEYAGTYIGKKGLKKMIDEGAI